MPPKAQLKRTYKRIASAGFKLTGQPIGVADADSRREIYTGVSGTGVLVEGNEEQQPTRKPKLNFEAILAEAEKGDPTVPTKSAVAEKDGKEDVEASTKADNSDRKTPCLALPKLLRKIEHSNRVRAEREASRVQYKHNSLLLSHIFNDALYTHSLCRRCTRTRRCPRHREPYQVQTSVSLCDHVSMNLYWQVNDPVNHNCSWKLEIKEYFAGKGDERRPDEAGRFVERARRDHEGCNVHRPNRRVRLLAERVVEDMRDNSVMGHETLRGSLRRTVREIQALLGAYERAAVISQQTKEKKEKAAAKKAAEQKKARNKPTKTLSKVTGEKNIEEREAWEQLWTEDSEIVKTGEEEGNDHDHDHDHDEDELEEDEVQEDEVQDKEIQDKEVEDKEVEEELEVETQADSPQPRPNSLKSYWPTPELTPSSASDVLQASPALPASPSPQQQTPPEMASASPPNTEGLKRKRSISPGLDVAVKKTKKVHWNVENNASEDPQRPRILSPVHVPDEGDLSPVGDEVDYDVKDMD